MTASQNCHQDFLNDFVFTHNDRFDLPQDLRNFLIHCDSPYFLCIFGKSQFRKNIRTLYVSSPVVR